jgi:hypothetical protein
MEGVRPVPSPILRNLVCRAVPVLERLNALVNLFEFLPDIVRPKVLRGGYR